MTVWFVTTPTYSYVEPVLDDGSGPTFDASDWLEVEADTRREAISKAVRQWIAECKGRYAACDYYVVQRKQDGLCPFTGVHAESEEECKQRTKASPPERLPDPEWDVCDVCQPSHPGAVKWRWVDEHHDPDLRWGWFAWCGKERLVGEGIPFGLPRSPLADDVDPATWGTCHRSALQW